MDFNLVLSHQMCRFCFTEVYIYGGFQRRHHFSHILSVVPKLILMNIKLSEYIIISIASEVPFGGINVV